MSHHGSHQTESIFEKFYALTTITRRLWSPTTGTIASLWDNETGRIKDVSMLSDFIRLCGAGDEPAGIGRTFQADSEQIS